MSETLLVALITGLSGSGLGAALVAYFKDRKKDNATAKLTDVQALQQQVLLLTQVSDFLRKENDQLQKDYEESEEARRKMRAEMESLRTELEKVKRSAARTQEQCDHLSAQLEAVMENEKNG